ncbi:MAG TPA: hypothetical protein ENK56_02825 [Chloroflexi bacterium]|nr:hypothetical protein [Chloroflexota bacterium]
MNTQSRTQWFTQEMAVWFAEAEEEEVEQVERSPEKFTEPRGWALKWDGAGLSGVQDRQGGASSPSVEAR